MIDVRDVRRRARLRSWAWDYLVVLGWLSLVFAALGVPQLLGLFSLRAIWSRPARVDLFIGLLTVVPYVAYLTLSEAGPSRATWGKRRVGLEVAGTRGPASGSRMLLRNLVKAAPWQLGHMSAMRFAVQPSPTSFAATTFALSVAGLAGTVLPVLLNRRGLHDLVAGTSVIPTAIDQ